MALACACVFTSCKKDDDSPKEPTASLIGKWELLMEEIKQADQWVKNPNFTYVAGTEFIVFTEATITTISPKILPVPFPYTYNSETKEISSIMGGSVYVTKLTDVELEVTNVINTPNERFKYKRVN